MALAYAFEAKSIQSYILVGGKLRDVGGASALLDGLCSYASGSEVANDLVGLILEAVSWPAAQFSRRAGGAFVLTAHEDEAERLDQFRALWTLTIQLHAPGLSFVDAIGSAAGIDQASAIHQAMAGLLIAHNQPHRSLPTVPPLSRRSPRTGDPAVCRCRFTDELIDAATRIKRELLRAEGDSLTAKFGAPSGVRWPERMDEEEDGSRDQSAVFPLLADNRYIGVIHADGNRLGDLLLLLQDQLSASPESYAEHFLAFSNEIAAATQRAAISATGHLIEAYRRTLRLDSEVHVMPMRPIVLGGDDLTVIVRGDLAVPFTERFLRAFSEETGKAFETLRKGMPIFEEMLPVSLSAGAGIAFVKSSQPFYLAYELAERLARFAKSRAKIAAAHEAARHGKSTYAIVPSSCLAFHRVTTTIIDDYEEIRRQELVRSVKTIVGAGGDDTRTYAREASLNPYLVESDQSGATGFARLGALLSLAKLLNSDEMASGPLRLLASMTQVTPNEALRVYQRWRTVVGQRDSELKSDVLRRFDNCLRALGCPSPDEDVSLFESYIDGAWRPLERPISVEQWDGQNDIRARSPIFDALNYLAISKGGTFSARSTQENVA